MENYQEYWGWVWAQQRGSTNFWQFLNDGTTSFMRCGSPRIHISQKKSGRATRFEAWQKEMVEREETPAQRMERMSAMVSVHWFHWFHWACSMLSSATSSRDSGVVQHFIPFSYWRPLDQFGSGRNEVSMDIGDASGVVLAQNITAVVDPILR